MKAKSAVLFRMLRPTMSGEVTVTDIAIQVAVRGRAKEIPFARLGCVAEKRGWIWSRLAFRDREDPSEELRIGGISNPLARDLRATVLERQVSHFLERARLELEHLCSRDRYLNWQAWADWRARHEISLACIPPDVQDLPLTAALQQTITELLPWVRSAEESREARNQKFIEAELKTFKNLFDTLENRSLNPRQREAIICDEDNSLVVAGAGTGKTSTVVGKVAYILRKGLARPDEILLLAFTDKAREEMQNRLNRLEISIPEAVNVAVRTFHSLGLKILAEAGGVRPTVSPLAEDDESLEKLAENCLKAFLLDPGREQAVRKFLVRYRYPERHEADFESPSRHRKYLKAHGIRTLNGEIVKSYGELVIADFLTANGVRYEYEGKYKYPTATRERRQYKPDFHLLDVASGGTSKDIYIEYFGIDRGGQTAPGVDRSKYLDGIKWKRELHKRNGTKLIEMYYYELREGKFEEYLEARLRELGVAMMPLPGSVLLSAVEDEKNNPLVPVAKLLCTFLRLFKSNSWTLSDLRDRLPRGTLDQDRARVFLEVFEGFLKRYSDELARTGEIDFADMIVDATKAVRSGNYHSPFRYVLVDEFQDISRGRAELLKALLEQHHDRRLFCVGDDWQSIFRFTGSDIGIMVNFASHFGVSRASTRRIDLDETFRLTRESVEISSRFIQKNQAQLEKTLVAKSSLGKSPIRIIHEIAPKSDVAGLHKALEEIAEGRVPASVLILGRYNRVLPKALDTPSLQFTTLTVHKAKGLQADYVVVLDVTAGRYGFPTEISDDPLLGLVLSAPDEYPNAEERRLFYVALTRARNRTYLITDLASRSAFIEELEGEEYHNLVESDYESLIESGMTLDRVVCPECGGAMIRREGENGTFYGCRYFPYCNGTLKACRRCGKGASVKRGGGYECTNPNCRRT